LVNPIDHRGIDLHAHRFLLALVRRWFGVRTIATVGENPRCQAPFGVVVLENTIAERLVFAVEPVSSNRNIRM
jgi:hypothetical protein